MYARNPDGTPRDQATLTREEQNDLKEARFAAYAVFAVVNWHMGKSDRGAENVAAALELMPHVDVSDLVRDTGYDMRCLVYSIKASLHAQRGEYGQVLEASDAALAMARVSKRPANLAMTLTYRSGLLQSLGDFAQAEAASREAIEVADEQLLVHHAAQAGVIHGQCLLAQGRVDEGAKLTAQSITALKEIGSYMRMGTYLGFQAVDEAGARNFDAARRRIAEAKEFVREFEEIGAGSTVEAREGIVEATAGNVGAAEAAFRRSIELAEHKGWFGYKLGTAIPFAELLLKAGRTDEAGTLLTEAVGQVFDGHDWPVMQRAQAMLARLG